MVGGCRMVTVMVSPALNWPACVSVMVRLPRSAFDEPFGMTGWLAAAKARLVAVGGAVRLEPDLPLDARDATGPAEQRAEDRGRRGSAGTELDITDGHDGPRGARVRLAGELAEPEPVLPGNVRRVLELSCDRLGQRQHAGLLVVLVDVDGRRRPDADDHPTHGGDRVVSDLDGERRAGAHVDPDRRALRDTRVEVDEGLAGFARAQHEHWDRRGRALRSHRD